MRIVFRIDLGSAASCASLCAAAVAMFALPAGVNAQEAAQPRSATIAETADAGSATLASPTLAAVTSPNPTAADTSSAAALDPTVAGPDDSDASRRDLAGNPLSFPADVASATDPVLDDRALSRQRGGFGGMVMVVATPQLMRGFNNGGNGVTLWDEIAPPSQLPVPVDVARSAQGNVTSYQRN